MTWSDKSTGLGDRFYVGKYDISGDTGAIDTAKGGFDTDDVTGLDKFAHERIGLLHDGTLDFTSFFNRSVTANAEGSHTVLKALPTTDILVSYLVGTGVGNAMCVMNAKQVDYAITRNANGSIRMKTHAVCNSFGIQWMQQLTAGKVTHASATNGTSIDNGTSSAFGASAAWHVFAVASGTVGGQIQDSADNVTFGAVTGMTFNASAVRTAQRLDSTTITTVIKRYVRFITTGTFTNAKVAVGLYRFPTAQI